MHFYVCILYFNKKLKNNQSSDSLMYLNFLEVIHEGQRASGHLPRVQCLKTKNPLALSNYLTRSASFRLAEKFSCLSLRHIPIIDLLIIDILFHLTENSTYYMELC